MALVAAAAPVASGRLSKAVGDRGHLLQEKEKATEKKWQNFFK